MLEPLTVLSQAGWTVTRVKPKHDGIIDADEFAAAVTKETQIVTLMCANNETGALQPMLQLARLLRSRGFGGVIVSDAVQMPEKASFNLADYIEAASMRLLFRVTSLARHPVSER